MKAVQIQVLLNVLDEVTQRYDEMFELKERLLQEAKYKSTHDLLTSLYNRSYFEMKVRELIKKHEPFCMVFLDLDNFKHVNDTYGHKSGDEVLIEVADILTKNLKGRDIIGRFGGDEFVIALRSNKQNSVKIMQSIIDKIGNVFKIYNITASVGIAEYPETTDYKELLKKADEMMYKAKKSGKNKIAY